MLTTYFMTNEWVMMEWGIIAYMEAIVSEKK